jgi:hypothetical protein
MKQLKQYIKLRKCNEDLLLSELSQYESSLND